MSWETGIPTKTTSSSTGKPDKNTFPFGSTALQVKPQPDLVCVGSSAGIVEHCCMFPIDTVKVSPNFSSLNPPFSLKTHIQASKSQISFSSVTRVLYEEQGITRFWKGTHVVALGCIPSHACYFAVYEKLKVLFDFNNEEIALVTTAMMGMTTTLVHDFFITPSDGKTTISVANAF